MTDPYQILGVSPNASEDEIKAAYRKLSQRYHPDMQSGNSVMEDIANQKMAEINAAFDEIMNRKRSGGNSEQDAFAQVRSLIEQGSYTQADSLLEADRRESSAEWNFLKGTVCLSRGWMNDALDYCSKAVSLDPNNGEYQAVLSRLRGGQNGNMQGNPYQGANNGMNTANCLCSACQCLMCADCACDICDCFF